MAAGASLSQTLQNIGNTLGVAIMVTALGEATVGDLGSFPAMWVASAVTTSLAVAVCVLAPTLAAPARRERGLR